MLARHKLLLTFAAFVSTISMAIPSYGASRRPPARKASLPSGVVVEEVGKDSAGEKAGIKPGDVPLSWVRLPNPPANSKEARGRIDSPFDVADVEIEQAPRGEVRLSGTREGKTFSVALSRGEWKVKTRPQMPGSVLSAYKQGKKLIDTNETKKGIALWRQAAARAAEEKSWTIASWLYLKVSDAWVDVRKGDEAHAAYQAAIEVAKKAAQPSILALIWDAKGSALKKENDFPKAESAYREALRIREKESPKSLNVAASLRNLGSVAYYRGDLSAAENLFRKALAIREALAPDSLDVASSLNNIGSVAWGRGDLAAAEEFFKRALTIREKLAPGSLDVAGSLNNLGLVAYGRGDLAAAEEFHKRALAIHEKLAPGSLAVATSLNNIGNVAYDRGDLAAAEEFQKRALAIDEKLAPGSLAVAGDLSSLAAVAYRRGDLAAAEEFHKRALATKEKLAPGSLDVAGSLNNVGVVASDRGDLAAAEEFHKRALAIREKLAPGSLAVATSLNNLGTVAHDRGDLAAAEEFFKRALTIHEKLAPGSRAVASSLNNIGNIAWSRGDLATAEDFYRKALAIHEKLAPGSLDVAASLNNLGAVAADRGDLSGAEDFYRKALAIQEKLAPGSLDAAMSLNNLGNVAGNRGDLAAAGEFYKRALAIREKLAPGSLYVALSLSNIGNVAEKRGDLAAAEEFHKRALAIREEFAPGSLDVASSLYNLGTAARDRGDLAAAGAFYRKSVDIRGKLAPGTRGQAEGLHDLGMVYRRSGRRTEALDHLRRAVEVLETQKGKLGGTEEVKSAFAATYADYYRDYLEILLELGRADEGFHVLERSRARGLLAMLAERDLVFSGDIAPELEKEQKLTDAEYDRTLGSIAKLSPEKDKEQVDRLLGHLREVRDKQAGITERIRKASPRYASLQYPQPLDLEAARGTLDPATVLLSYSVGKEKTFLFVVLPAGGGKGSGMSVFTLPIGEESLRKKVEAFRNLLQRKAESARGASAQLVSQGTRLYADLVKPAEKLIAAADRVLICPDGPLHTLPFGALVKGTQRGRPSYFVEWKPLHAVVSATVYAEMKKSRREGPMPSPGVELVAFGDPKYPAVSREKAEEIGSPEVRSAVRRGYGLEPLLNTREEVDRIANLYAPGAAKYLGDQATEERAKAIGKDTRYIHFACHGLLDERFPLDSSLALTIPEKPAEGQDNGLLQAWEIFEKVRIDADLVTLSACETGLGKEMGGEGLVGLTRAFQYAGARSILASLWSVADESTAELMKRFYGYLKSGKSKDEALRQAQVDLIKDPSGRYSNPFHWAAFELIGDWK